MPNSPEPKKRSWIPERKAFQRNVDNSAFYNSWAWRKARKRYLNKHPLCVVCESKGISTAATVVDHIIPINQGGDKLNESNFQSMCEHHHNQKSGKESHGIGKKKGI